jgi:hypothetical protein
MTNVSALEFYSSRTLLKLNVVSNNRLRAKLQNHFLAFLPVALASYFISTANVQIFSSVQTETANTVFTVIHAAQQQLYLYFAKH